MTNKTLTREEIQRGINALIVRVSKMGLLAHIIDPYFDGFHITTKTFPLSLLLTEHTAHIYGQLHRLFFDLSKSYKTASIESIYKQLLSLPDPQLKGRNHLDLFRSVEKQLCGIKSKCKKKLQLYTDKYYAHTEIRSEKQAKQDYEDFRMSWHEIKQLIEESKNLINILSLYLSDTQSDFAEGQYDEDQRKFWKLIDPIVFENYTKK